MDGARRMEVEDQDDALLGPVDSGGDRELDAPGSGGGDAGGRTTDSPLLLQFILDPYIGSPGHGDLPVHPRPPLELPLSSLPRHT